MATPAQRDSLLAITCPWCGATTGELCFVPGPRRGPANASARRGDRRPIRSLDAGCHDARWQAALGTSAPVIAAAVLDDEDAPRGRRSEPRSRTLVGAGATEDPARPW